MRNAKMNHYWVSLIARHHLPDLKGKQVFVVESIDNEWYRIISPYVDYHFDRYQMTKRGEVIIN